MGSSSRLQIGLLGPFELGVDGRATDLTSDRLRAILAALASSAGTPVSIDALGEYVWGAAQPVNLRRTVQTGITRLRGLLGGDTVVTRPGGYALMVAPDQVDAVRFERLLDAAAAAADPAAESREIAAALDLWRGMPYDGVAAERLASVEVPRLTERYLAALERAAELALDMGAIGAVAPRLRTEIERHPLRESLWARHLRLLARSGRSAEALTAYEGIRRRLADELGVDPGPELQQTYADLLSPPGPAPAVPGPAIPYPRQLPADLEFVGRDDLLARLDQTMDAADPTAPGMVVATLTGPGGAGKTSLAVHWAHRRHADFPDGQLFADLRGFAPTLPVEPAAALAGLLAGLGVQPDRIPLDPDARAALYRTVLAGRRTLVVLDNARDADQVRPLLPGGTGRVIVTSRHALGGLSAREGARRLPVDQLAPADSEELLRTRLRRHRAVVARATVTELARLCGHLPLALVIAAEYMGGHGGDAESLVQTLRDERARLDALDAPDGGGDPAASVRSVFSWSYAALDAETSRVFRTLADLLPPLDFGPEVAAVATGLPLPAARRVLDRLAGMHLLARSAGRRYRYHDLIRVYAAERCRAEDADAERLTATVRSLEWYLHTLQNAMGLIKPIDHPAALHDGCSVVASLMFDDPAAARAWCETERRALLFAAHRAAELGRPGLAWQLSWQLGRFLQMAPYSDELVELAELGAAAAAGVDEAARYIADSNLGNAYGRSYRWTEAVGCFRRALAGCRSAGDAGTESVVLMNLGVTLSNMGDRHEARQAQEAALAAARRSQGSPGPSMMTPNLAACLLNLGDALNALGRVQEGAARTEEALTLARRSGNRIIEGMCLGNLAESHEAMGDYARAESFNLQAQTVLREIGAGHGLADTLLAAVRIMVATGRPDQARSAYEEGMTLLRHDDPRIAELNRAITVEPSTVA